MSFFGWIDYLHKARMHIHGALERLYCLHVTCWRVIGERSREIFGDHFDGLGWWTTWAAGYSSFCRLWGCIWSLKTATTSQRRCSYNLVGTGDSISFSSSIQSSTSRDGWVEKAVGGTIGYGFHFTNWSMYGGRISVHIIDIMSSWWYELGCRMHL